MKVSVPMYAVVCEKSLTLWRYTNQIIIIIIIVIIIIIKSKHTAWDQKYTLTLLWYGVSLGLFVVQHDAYMAISVGLCC